jgi:hypothetical protein
MRPAPLHRGRCLRCFQTVLTARVSGRRPARLLTCCRQKNRRNQPTKHRSPRAGQRTRPRATGGPAKNSASAHSEPTWFCCDRCKGKEPDKVDQEDHGQAVCQNLAQEHRQGRPALCQMGSEPGCQSHKQPQQWNQPQQAYNQRVAGKFQRGQIRRKISFHRLWPGILRRC